ncbi:MAG: peptidoglycan DD-metalloendopeptidase family protein [Defluviitaleaceae bacterium]|nr:peptidoglycan DD-metalloendopeptidase family protein [Defluviitaleaceae bacterium]
MKKYLVGLLIAALVLPILPAAASQATRDQLREMERQRAAAGQLVSEQQNLLAGTEFEMSLIMAEMQELDQQIMDANEKLETIEYNLLVTELRLEEAEEELTIAREERDTQMEILRERVRVMHENGQAGFLEILFQAENISDFFSRWEYIRTVAQFDRDLLDSFEETEERIYANVENLAANRALIRDLGAQVEAAKREIDLRLAERALFFAALEEDAERHNEWLALLEEEAHAIDIEFGVVRDRYRAEVAEQERIRREAEEARRRAEAAARAAEQANRLASLNSFENFAWPLAIQGQFSSPFGNRPSPFNAARTEFHTGIDIAAPANTRINAAEAGYVRLAGWSASWGNWIIIDHANGYSTMYAHNTRNRVTEGQRVTRGQHIADVGTTGMSTGNHLHFEVRINGTHVDPMRYFGG